LSFIDDILHGTDNDPQLFDEHAAFHLHLHCYSIICATGRNVMESSLSLDVNKWLLICPWIKNTLTVATRNSLYRYTSDLNIRDSENVKFTVSAIKVEHQEQVRKLFKKSYEHLFDSYPSVKKLVKSALKNDLCMKPSQATMSQYGVTCSIWNHYSREGGAFWVVFTTTNPHCNDTGGYEGHNTNQQDDKYQQIVGCIGVKKRPKSSNHISNRNCVSYEINRFAVDSSLRGRGIGRQLLKCVEDFVRGKEQDNFVVKIIANTPTILESSNQFYLMNGFRVEQETSLVGLLVIRTFSKTL
jgi:Predicted P-loop ATPase fused to an acetyltransferase